ncbi:MAG: c-type cytochrome, partial [Planctomycetales bacterium]|nr:c-type cytochrome [Planctomycetales bacterium]
GDHDHCLHAFVFGPDGKLYFNFGNEVRSLFRPKGGTLELPLHGAVPEHEREPVVDLDGKTVEAHGKPYREGMVFRCDLDGSNVETLAWNFRNNYEVAVDAFGTLWQSDNDDDGNRGVRINFVMEFGNYGYKDELTGAGWYDAWAKAQLRGVEESQRPYYHWHQHDPGVIPNLLQTGGGSPTGIAIYEGTLLPETFRGQIIHCDAGPRVVRCYPVTPSGAGYTASIENLLTSSDSDQWYRPSDVCVSPDGAVYVSDWNDAGVGGHYMADQTLETMSGRVYRVAPRGHTATLPPAKFDSAADCMASLASPNMATRYLAWTTLAELGRTAEHQLGKAWQSHSPRTRARALFLLARIPQSGSGYVDTALKDEDENIRIVALRILRQDRSPEGKQRLLAAVEQLVRDPSPAVRRECCVALRHNSAAQVPSLWGKLAAQYDGQDRWYLEALGIGADGRWNECLAEYLAHADTTPSQRSTADIAWRSRGSESAGLIAAALASTELTADDKLRLVRGFDFQNDNERQRTLLEVIDVATVLGRPPEGGVEEETSRTSRMVAIELLLRMADAGHREDSRVAQLRDAMLTACRGTNMYVELARKFPAAADPQGLLEYAEQHSNDSSAVEALRLLISRSQDDLLVAALKSENRTGLVETMSRINDRLSNDLLRRMLLDLDYPAVIRQAAVVAVARQRDGGKYLLQLAESDRLPGDLKLVAGSVLSTDRDQQVRDRAGELLPMPKSRSARPLPSIEELARRTGDRSHGELVFFSEKANCGKCHQVGDKGKEVGPKLTEIGTKLGKDGLYLSILDPSAGVSFGYETHLLELKNGVQATGLIVSETPDEIVMKSSEDVVTRYRTSDIESRQKLATSLMPSGVTENLDEQELVDLIEYLSSLRAP